MSTELRGMDVSLLAAEDLSSYQYHFVVKDATTGKARLMDAATDEPFGVLQNAPESGQAAVIRTDGFSKIVANDALAVNALVKGEYVGAADCGKADAADTTGDIVRGIVAEAASAENDLATIKLVRFNHDT